MIRQNNNTSKRSGGYTPVDRFLFLLGTLLVFSLGIGQFSCGEGEVKLTKEDQNHIDTLRNHKIDSINKILDSICGSMQDSLIEIAVDSIVKERKLREERLREQLIPKNQ